MAYTVKVYGTSNLAYVARQRIARAVDTSRRFAVRDLSQVSEVGTPGHRSHGFVFTLQKVRLIEAKPYCGQHPGECVVGGPKKKTKYLEWDDWVAFHSIVNDALKGITADVWSLPLDTRGKMWIRKGLRRRVKFDYDETVNGYGRPVRIWNEGTDDQFAAE